MEALRLRVVDWLLGIVVVVDHAVKVVGGEMKCVYETTYRFGDKDVV